MPASSSPGGWCGSPCRRRRGFAAPERESLRARQASPRAPGRRRRSSPVRPCRRDDGASPSSERFDTTRCPRAARGRSCRRGRCTIVRGPFSGVPFNGAPSGVGRRSPVPPIVSIVPAARSTRGCGGCRCRRSADGHPDRARCCAAVEAAPLRPGPPSPENPATPVPASVEMTPRAPSTFRTTWLSRSAMYIDSRASNDDFVRHVQRRRGGRPAVAAVRALRRCRQSCGGARLQIEPPDPLVVEIAKIQRAIASDDDAVGIVDLRDLNNPPRRCR